jgi:HEAT repeat protein
VERPDVRFLEPLLERLDDPAEVVRIAAVEALGHSGDARVAQFLLVLLDDPSVDLVVAALQVLVKTGGVSLDSVVPLASHKEARVRATAVTALVSLGVNELDSSAPSA